jgi:hypothetical protein
MVRLARTQVLELLLDRKAADARHSREVSAREAEIARLQEYIDQEISELQQRQAQVRLADKSCTALHTSECAGVEASIMSCWFVLPDSGAPFTLL